jgi:hypothetical protein
MAKEHIITIAMVVKDKATGIIQKGGRNITKEMQKAGISVSKSGKVMVRAMDKTATATKRAAKETDRMRIKTSGLRRIIGRVRNALLVYVFALRPLIRLMGQAIKNAKAQEIAETKLRLAFEGSRLATRQQVEELKEYAVALQTATVFGDDEIINAQAMLATFQLTAEQIKKATPRILDMARGIGKLTGRQADLQQVAIAVGKGLTGQVGILSKYGVVISDAAKKSGDFNMILGELDKNFKDMSLAQMNFIDQSTAMKNSFGDFTQAIGEFITKNPEVIRGIKEMAQVFADAAKHLSFKARIPLRKELNDFIDEYKTNSEAIIRIRDDLIESLEEKPEGLYEDDPFVKAFDISELISNPELEALRQRQKELKGLIDNLKKEFGIGIDEKGLKKQKTDLERAIENFEKWGIDIEEIGKKTSQSLERNFSDFFFDAMINDLKTLEDYFAAFGRNVLKILSDMFATSVMQDLFSFLTPGGDKKGGIISGILDFFGFGKAQGGGPVDAGTAKAHSGGVVGGRTMRNFHGGGIVNANLLEGEGILNTRGLRDLGPDNLNKLNEGRNIEQGAGNAPIIIIHAWDASDIRRNEGAIIAIISKAISSNTELRGVIKQYG